jgi:hypothetical protein
MVIIHYSTQRVTGKFFKSVYLRECVAKECTISIWYFMVTRVLFYGNTLTECRRYMFSRAFNYRDCVVPRPVIIYKLGHSSKSTLCYRMVFGELANLRHMLYS